MSDLENSPVNKKKQRLQKFSKQSQPDFTYWTEEQKLRYQYSKNELERENILGEIQMKMEEEILNNQILQHKQIKKEQKLQSDEFFFSNSDQEESIQSSQSEEGEVRNEKARQKQKQKDQEDQIVNIIKPEIEEKIDFYEKAIREVTIKRNQIEQILMNVFYNNVIEGAFVRIQEPQLKKYALGQIIAVIEGDNSYSVGDIQTYKLLKLQIAEIKEPKLRHITLVSNQKIETQEYILWKKSREDVNQSLPNKEQLIKKSKDIQRALQLKLTDEQIEKKIIQTVEEWLNQERPQIYFHDIPYYETFLQNQIKTQKQTLDRLDEYIHEITESQIESDQIRLEDTTKLINLKRQQADCRDRIQFLMTYIEKIKSLIQKHNHKLKNRIKTESSTNKKQEYDARSQETIDNSITRAQKLQENKERMKLLDQGYIQNIFKDVQTFDENKNIKQEFLHLHSRFLEIDQIINEFQCDDF